MSDGSVHSDESQRAAASSRIAGRSKERAAVEAWLATVHEGPSVFVLEGSAGIGKTTLWRHAVTTARRGHQVLWCQPAQPELRLPYSSLADLLDRVDERALAHLPLPQREALAAALLLEQRKGADRDEQAVARGTYNVLRELAGDGPLVIAVDDAQWLDEASAAALSFALRRLVDEPVGLLLALRSGGARTLLAPGVLGTDRPVTRCPVSPLSLPATQQLLADRLGLQLPRGKLRTLYEISGGNPYYALEIGRAVQRDSLGLESGATLPDSVLMLVEDRLAGLPEDARTLVLAAAVMPKPTLAVIGEAIGGDVWAALPAAEDAGVLEVLDGELRFTHPLLAEAAASTATPARRRWIHGRLAEVVVSADERLYHRAFGTDVADESLAAELESAARLMRARGPLQPAAALASRAVQLTPGSAPADRARRTVLAAALAVEIGELPRARSLVAPFAAQPPGSPSRASALGWLGRVHVNAGEPADAERLYLAAIADPGGDPVARSAAAEGLAELLYFQRDRLTEAADHAAQAVAWAVESGSRVREMNARALSGLIDLVVGRPEGRTSIDVAFEAERSFDGTPDADDRLSVSPSVVLGTALVWCDRFDDARAILEQANVRMEGRGEESSAGWIVDYLCWAAFLAGDWAAASELADEAVAVAAVVGQQPQRVSGLGLRSMLRAARGDVEAARADADLVLSDAERAGSSLARIYASGAMALLELSLENPEGAVAVLEQFAADLEQGGVREPGSTRFDGDLVEALLLTGRRDAALAVLDRLEQRGRVLGRTSALASAARCHGLVSAADGDLVAAESYLENSVGLFDKVGMPFERARSLLALGTVRRHARAQRPAREALEEAGQEFERLGASLWAERVVAEISRIGGRRSGSATALTDSEMRIASLVAQGMTDKEIAAALFLAPKSVGTVLSRIYRKVGVNSRTQLTVWLASYGAAVDEPSSAG